MLYTKEFYELLEAFEKIAKTTVRTGNQGFKREHKDLWKNKNYYCDGEANKAFILFLHGYSYGKCVFQ